MRPFTLLLITHPILAFLLMLIAAVIAAALIYAGFWLALILAGTYWLVRGVDFATRGRR